MQILQQIFSRVVLGRDELAPLLLVVVRRLSNLLLLVLVPLVLVYLRRLVRLLLLLVVLVPLVLVYLRRLVRLLLVVPPLAFGTQ